MTLRVTHKATHTHSIIRISETACQVCLGESKSELHTKDSSKKVAEVIVKIVIEHATDDTEAIKVPNVPMSQKL